jgi:hypothetical protein
VEFGSGRGMSIPTYELMKRVWVLESRRIGSNSFVHGILTIRSGGEQAHLGQQISDPSLFKSSPEQSRCGDAPAVLPWRSTADTIIPCRCPKGALSRHG